MDIGHLYNVLWLDKMVKRTSKKPPQFPVDGKHEKGALPLKMDPFNKIPDRM